MKNITLQREDVPEKFHEILDHVMEISHHSSHTPEHWREHAVECYEEGEIDYALLVLDYAQWIESITNDPNEGLHIMLIW